MGQRPSETTQLMVRTASKTEKLANTHLVCFYYTLSTNSAKHSQRHRST